MDPNELLNGDDLMDYATGGVDYDEPATQPPEQTQASPESREVTNEGAGQQGHDPSEQLGTERQREQATETQVQAVGNQSAQPQELTPYRGNFLTDKAGNIYDRDGKTVLAKAGAERRLFDRLGSVQESLQYKDQYIRQLEQEREQLRQAPREGPLEQAAKQLKFSEQEVMTGLRITNMWKQNPLNAVAHVLAEVKKLGYNDQQIGQAVASYNPNSDPAMIQSMIREAIQPIAERINPPAANVPPNDMRAEISRVFATYPGAHLHQDVLAQTLRDNPNMDLDTATRGLLAFAQKHGLDFGQPLRPQIEARRAQQVRPNQPDMPGRVPTGNVETFRDQSSSPFAEPSDSYGDIVRATVANLKRQRA